jgi:hypothetical protein
MMHSPFDDDRPQAGVSRVLPPVVFIAGHHTTGVQSFAFEPCDDERTDVTSTPRPYLASLDVWMTIWSGTVMGAGIALIVLKLLGLTR